MPNSEEQFISLLQTETGINYNSAARAYTNYVGIQPDGAALLFKATQLPNIASVVEFGSGFSTLWLAIGASRRNIPFHSYEEHPGYLNITRALLEHHNLDPNYILPYTPDVNGRADLIFFDPADKWTLLTRHQIELQSAKCVLVDDADFNGLFSWVVRSFLTNSMASWVYNPTGRYNRHILITMKDILFNIAGWVESWRPK